MSYAVCGIDPGLGTTGYAVVRDEMGALTIVDAGVCRFEAGLPLALRLRQVEEDIQSMLIEHRPDLVAVEQLYAHYKHPRTAILMGHARGVILVAAAKQGIEVRDYAATRVKRYLTGNGRASKAQVQDAVARVLRLPELPEPSDLADALAIGLCALDDLRSPKPVEMRA